MTASREAKDRKNEKARQRRADERAAREAAAEKILRAEASHKFLFGPPSSDLAAWQEANRSKHRHDVLHSQIERARRKGSRRTLVDLDVLEELVKTHAEGASR